MILFHGNDIYHNTAIFALNKVFMISIFDTIYFIISVTSVNVKKN